MADGRWPRWQRATVLRPLLWSPPNPHPLIFFYLSMGSDPNWPCVLGTSIRSHFPKRVQGYPSPQSPKWGGGRDNSGGSRSLPNKALSVSFIWRTNYLPSQCGGSLHMAIGRPACKSTVVRFPIGTQSPVGEGVAAFAQMWLVTNYPQEMWATRQKVFQPFGAQVLFSAAQSDVDIHHSFIGFISPLNFFFPGRGGGAVKMYTRASIKTKQRQTARSLQPKRRLE